MLSLKYRSDSCAIHGTKFSLWHNLVVILNMNIISAAGIFFSNSFFQTFIYSHQQDINALLKWVSNYIITFFISLCWFKKKKDKLTFTVAVTIPFELHTINKRALTYSPTKCVLHRYKQLSSGSKDIKSQRATSRSKFYIIPCRL